MSAKKLGSDLHRPNFGQDEAEGLRVHAVYTLGVGFLDGHGKAAFIASGVSKQVHDALGKFPGKLSSKDPKTSYDKFKFFVQSSPGGSFCFS